MTSRLFQVDMSEASRDYAAVALEPGLAMLDSNGANYAILRRWLGLLIAEPELQAGEKVSFYVRDPERGRLENVVCLPVSLKDLRGPLKEDLATIEASLRRAKPESSNETLLHKHVSRALRQMTENLDHGAWDGFFFKYRRGNQPWRLVWCWGYQRRDQQPSKATICTNVECQNLFAHRPKTKRRCPVCQTAVARRTGGPLAVGGIWTWVVVLLLAAILVVLLNPPRLVVSPDRWQGPVGGEVAFRVTESKWLFWNQDVTDRVIAQSDDPRVLAFERLSTTARALRPGQTVVTFRFDNRVGEARVDVGEVRVPDSLRIEPATPQLAVGSTVPLRVWGVYSDGPEADLSDRVTWELADTKVATVSGSRLLGAAAGKTKLTASWKGSGADETREAAVDLEVTDVEFKSLQLALDPQKVSMDRGSRLQVHGVAAGGEKYDLIGSPRLKLDIEPYDAARLEDGEYVVGLAAGRAKLTAAVGELHTELDFEVAGTAVPPGTLSVRPAEVTMSVGEYFDLDVLASDPDELDAVSSDPAVVVVIGNRTLSAHQPGKAEVTFTAGDQKQTVQVTVSTAEFKSIEIQPAAIVLGVGQLQRFEVLGVTAAGKRIPLAADQLKWLRQPISSHVDLKRDRFELLGLVPTSQALPLEVQFADLKPATATVSVRAGAEEPESWGVYPPIDIARPGTVVSGGSYLGGPLRMVPNHGLVVDTIPPGSPLELAGLPPGSVIRSIDGVDITGYTPEMLEAYLAEHPIVQGTVLGYAGVDGIVRDVRLGLDARALELVRVLGITPRNVSATAFDAAVTLYVRQQAEYRIVDDAGNPLSDWSTHGPAAEATILVAQIPRTAGRVEYDLYVERQLGGDIKRFPFVVSLAPGSE